MATSKTKGPQALRSFQKSLASGIARVGELGLPKLGVAYQQLSGRALHNALIAHRLTKKFEVPAAKRGNERRERSIRAFLDANEDIAGGFDYRDLPGDHRRDFLKSAEVLRGLLKGFRLSYRFAGFPSGESAFSARGETSLFEKLIREDQWTVTVDALPYAARIAYNTLALKRVVRERFARKSGPCRDKLLRTWYAQWLGTDQSLKCGMFVFLRMFGYLCEICVSVVTTVPKDNVKDRVITKEPTWNMVAQLSFAHDLLDCLQRNAGIHLGYWQNVHRALIRSGRATIDFSSASDRNKAAVCSQLWPRSVWKHVEKLRPHAFEVRENDEVCYVASNMVSPMGTGFTFEIMTLTLLAYSRVYDARATVFGDDVIIAADQAEHFVRLTTALGWKVNEEKSFAVGNFRESCGAFADLTLDKLLHSYDLTYPADMQAAFVVTNKLCSLLGHAKGELYVILRELWWDLLSFLPRHALCADKECLRGLDDYRAYVPERHLSALLDPGVVKRPVIQLWEEQWNRPIVLVERTTLRPQDASNAEKRDHPAVTLACVLRAGAVRPLRSALKERVVKVDLWSGSPLLKVTLCSVL